MRILQGLRSRDRFTDILGGVEGCLAYLGVEITPAWLFGGTGHAFVVNVTDTLCPSGPSAWNREMLYTLAPNLGYTLRGVRIERSAAGEAFPAHQREAWDLVRTSIDRGVLTMHPPRPEPEQDWSTPVQSPETARLLHDAAAAERDGLGCLTQVVALLAV